MYCLLRPAILAATALAIPAPANAPAELRITVYNHARVPLNVLEEALADLRRIFRLAGLEAVIEVGNPEAAEGFHIAYPEPPRRGREQETACLARHDIALRITVALPSQGSTILGMALPLARKGLNVVVYDDRIRSVAAQWVRPHAAVLAHTMAHEIGHVLLRSSEHARTGIMSGTWTDEEYSGISNRTLMFSREHAKAMRVTLAGSLCPSAAQMNHPQGVLLWTGSRHNRRVSQ